MEYEKVNPIWDSGNYILMGGIDDKSCEGAINFIQYHNMSDSPIDRLTLVINSPGGSVSSAMGLIDVMKTSNIPVDTLASGNIASCGVIITMAGAKRAISETCSVMSHQYTWGKSGKHHELIANRKAEDMTNEMLTNHYMKCTKKSKKFVEKHLLSSSDTWLTPQEAVEMGIVDEVRNIY